MYVYIVQQILQCSLFIPVTEIQIIISKYRTRGYHHFLVSPSKTNDKERVFMLRFITVWLNNVYQYFFKLTLMCFLVLTHCSNFSSFSVVGYDNLNSNGPIVVPTVI